MLRVNAGQRGELAEPRQLRAQPDLAGGAQLPALIDRAGAMLSIRGSGPGDAAKRGEPQVSQKRLVAPGLSSVALVQTRGVPATSRKVPPAVRIDIRERGPDRF